MKMELRQLEAFRAIATLGSFSAAATRLHTTQPAISARIRSLEFELGGPLFDRSAKPARLTPLGHKLLDYADRIGSLVTEAQGIGKGAAGTIRSARLGIPSALVSRWAPFLIGEVYRNNPNARVELHIDRSVVLQSMLTNGEIDFALTIGQPNADELVSTPVARYSYCWIQSNTHPATRKIHSISEINKPVATYSKTSAAYIELRDYLRKNKLEHISLSGSNSTDAILKLVSEGLAIGLVMSIALDDDAHPMPVSVMDLPTSMISDVEYFASFRRDGATLLGEYLASAASTFSGPRAADR
ncbi:LysR family transcriptional regulator [Devosia albogilva]|uniref:LysR family transcriptional regulator n=1 Tax=Devosia albogilva TaxID=429726 RepID=A0ABW5QKM0_9HYPH